LPRLWARKRTLTWHPAYHAAWRAPFRVGVLWRHLPRYERRRQSEPYALVISSKVLPPGLFGGKRWRRRVRPSHVRTRGHVGIIYGRITLREVVARRPHVNDLVGSRCNLRDSSTRSISDDHRRYLIAPDAHGRRL
jgi:hypothetical protein